MCRCCCRGERSDLSVVDENTLKILGEYAKAMFRSFIIWITYLDTDRILIPGVKGM